MNPLQWNVAMLLAIESMRKAPTADNYELLARLSKDGAHVVAAFPGERLVVFSQDGRWVASREKGELVVRAARGGRVRARVDAESIAFRDICFTPAAGRVVGYSDEALLVDVAAERRIRLPIGIERGSLLNVSANCRFLTAAHGGQGHVIDLEANTVVGNLPIPPQATALATSNDGGAVAYVEGARATTIDPRTKAVRSQWQAGVDITGASFDADGQQLRLSLGAKGMVLLDAASGRVVAQSAARGLPAPGGELSVDLEQDGRELVTWDVPRGVWTKRVALSTAPTSRSWSDDGEFLAFGGGEGDGAARVLQSESWRQLARFAFSFPGTTLMRTPQIFVRLSPSGTLASAADGNRAVVFEIHQDRPVAMLPADVKPGPAALSGDGRRTAFRTTGQKVVVVDNATGRQLVSLDCPSVALRPPMQLDATGRMLAVNCGGTAVVVYDIDAQRQVVRLPLDFASPMAMSRDGRVVFAGSAVVRSANGQRVRDVRGGHAAAIDPRGRQIALAGVSEIDLVDLRPGAAPRRIEPAINALESVAFSDDGSLLAAGGRDMRVKIFDTATGHMVRLLEHIEQDQWMFRIHRLVFSPSGQLIATVADDPTMTDIGRPGTARVFDVATGREVARIPFPELAHDLRFAPDDSALEIAVGRRRIRWERYPLSAAAMIARACTLVQRNLETIEWARFMGGEPRRDTCPAAR